MTKWKVGDKCHITLPSGAAHHDCKILYIDNLSVVFSSSATSSMPVYLGDIIIRPIKTPAEIERERVLNDIMLALAVPKTSGWHGAALRALECAYDLGYIIDPNKKVKPLSMEDRIHIETSSISIRNAINRLIDGGHIIIGADNE